MGEPPKYRDGEWLERKYHGEGLTQQEMADECGVAVGTISAWMADWNIPAERDPEERFWEKVGPREPGECWEWQATLVDDRYGHFWLDDRLVLAHRAAYRFERGEIGDNNVLHTCDNTKCVNPNHLYLGDQTDNANDMWERDRHPGPGHEGTDNPAAVLTEDDVRDIRSRCKSGEPQHSVADDYPIGQGHISDIVRRKLWKGVE